MKTSNQTTIQLPADIRRALTANTSIHTLWKALTPIAQRDFVSWITSAKQPETRARRISIMVSKLASGKKRPCCYAVVPMNLYKALGELPKAKATWKDLSPDERRDFVDWIELAKEKETKAERIEKACVLLTQGKRGPYRTRKI